MKKYVLILLFLLCSVIVQAQNNPERKSIEEQQAELIVAAGVDRILILQDLAFRVRFRDATQALLYAEEALDLSKAYSQDSLQAESLYRLGTIYNLKDQFANSIVALIDARQIFIELNDIPREIKILQLLGAVYTKTGQYNEASELYFEMLNHTKKLNDAEGEVFALTRIAVIQLNLDNYRVSQRFFQNAITKAREIGDWVGETIALSEAGLLEEKVGNTQKAIEYYQKAIEIFNSKDVKHAIPTILFSISTLYKDEDKVELALEITNEAIELADSLNNQAFVIDGLLNLSNIYASMGENEKAISVLEEGRSIAEVSGLGNSELKILTSLSRNYSSLEKNEEALKTAERAKSIAISKKSWEAAKSALETLIDVEKKEGLFIKALSHQEELMMVQDSIIDSDRAKKIAELEARYQVSQKEKEIQALQAENTKSATKQIALIIGISLLMVIGLLIFRSQKLKIQRKQVQLENSQLKSKQLEKDLEYKNKQLTTQSLNMVQKNEMMEELKGKIELIKEKGSSKELNSLSNLVDYSISLDEDWKQFQMHFEEAHSGFYHTLKEQYPDLTPNELRLSALVKLNLSIKEMAAIIGISPDSVKTARYRLRKKLRLKTQDNLTDFMLELEKASSNIS